MNGILVLEIKKNVSIFFINLIYNLILTTPHQRLSANVFILLPGSSFSIVYIINELTIKLKNPI